MFISPAGNCAAAGVSPTSLQYAAGSEGLSSKEKIVEYIDLTELDDGDGGFDDGLAATLTKQLNDHIIDLTGDSDDDRPRAGADATDEVVFLSFTPGPPKPVDLLQVRFI